jgi:hypothetical protein
MKGGGGGLVVNINAQGADAAGLRRVENAIRELYANFNPMAVGAMRRHLNAYGRDLP